MCESESPWGGRIRAAREAAEEAERKERQAAEEAERKAKEEQEAAAKAAEEEAKQKRATDEAALSQATEELTALEAKLQEITAAIEAKQHQVNEIQQRLNPSRAAKDVLWVWADQDGDGILNLAECKRLVTLADEAKGSQLDDGEWSQLLGRFGGSNANGLNKAEFENFWAGAPVDFNQMCQRAGLECDAAPAGLTARLTVGDVVKVTSGSKNVGDVGVISRDDHDNNPYKIRINGTEVGYFTPAQVTAATEEEKKAFSDNQVPRPTVGDRVTVIGGNKNVGETGTITRDDHDNSPYKINFGSGDIGYFTEAQVRKLESTVA
jgi:hypothetical protein